MTKKKTEKNRKKEKVKKAATKSIFLAIENIEKNKTGTIHNWKLIQQQFLTIFESRCKL